MEHFEEAEVVTDALELISEHTSLRLVVLENYNSKILNMKID